LLIAIRYSSARAIALAIASCSSETGTDRGRHERDAESGADRALHVLRHRGLTPATVISE